MLQFKKRYIRVFLRSWNGAIAFPFVLIVFLVLNHFSSQTTGDQYPLVGVISIGLGIAKIFLGEAAASFLLYCNQYDYFRVIHDDKEQLPDKLCGEKYRNQAYATYYAFFIGACLILAFA